MSNNIQTTKGTILAYREDKNGEVLLVNYPVIGIVKNNIDPNRNGRIWVYIDGITPDNPNGWARVDYASPWFGVASSKQDPTKGSEDSDFGKFVGNPHSYGMWASAPDVGSRVLCIFVQGRLNQGYYIAGVPITGLHHMVPGIGGSSAVKPNKTEASTYGDVKLLPTTEVNYSDPAIRKDSQIYNLPKPVHSYQASIFAQQGLIRDNIRGIISSSSQRESPSRVFGISTPGGTIYSGGYSNSVINKAIKTASNEKLQQEGRTGGHSIVMDDGTVDGRDQLMRLRTSGGHQITMSDSGQTIFVIHGNGQSWIELGKEGTVDIFSSNSFNVRTQGDVNLHADRDVNIHAKRNLNMFGNSVKIEADTVGTIRAGQALMQHSMGIYTAKADGTMSLDSTGPNSITSSTSMFVKGKVLMLNTGSGAAAPTVSKIDKKSHVDSFYNTEKGWVNPGPVSIASITTRAPTHQPYAAANKGVDLGS